jgi:DNA-binding transcriptional regulator YdaS (Cro superfamily)
MSPRSKHSRQIAGNKGSPVSLSQANCASLVPSKAARAPSATAATLQQVHSANLRPLLLAPALAASQAFRSLEAAQTARPGSIKETLD